MSRMNRVFSGIFAPDPNEPVRLRPKDPTPKGNMGRDGYQCVAKRSDYPGALPGDMVENYPEPRYGGFPGPVDYDD